MHNCNTFSPSSVSKLGRDSSPFASSLITHQWLVSLNLCNLILHAWLFKCFGYQTRCVKACVETLRTHLHHRKGKRKQCVKSLSVWSAHLSICPQLEKMRRTHNFSRLLKSKVPTTVNAFALSNYLHTQKLSFGPKERLLDPKSAHIST